MMHDSDLADQESATALKMAMPDSNTAPVPSEADTATASDPTQGSVVCMCGGGGGVQSDTAGHWLTTVPTTHRRVRNWFLDHGQPRIADSFRGTHVAA